MHVFLSFFFFGGQILFAVFFFFLVLAFVTGAPFVPSSRTATAAMIQLARLRPGMNVYDLGSGDGRLVAGAKQKGAKAIGFEINPVLVLWANIFRHAPTRWKSLWKADIHDADVVFVYLLPGNMQKLVLKLKKECRPGTLVVSNSFIFPNWNIIRQNQIHHIYAFMI